LPESVAEYGGRALKERVGHTFVQERMWKSKALLGVEDSGHYFYQDNKYADSGIITSLLMCQIYSEADKSFSALVDKYSKYYKAENVSFNVRDPDAAFKKIKTQLKKVYKNAQIFDGISVSEEDYWFNIRLSETQPLIRLNIEGISKAVVDRAQSEIIKLIRTCLGGKR
jgi:phosphomannomutase